MELSDKKAGDVYVILVEGRLDAATGPELEKKIIGSIDAGEKNVVVNFAELNYISSAGLRVLLLAAKKLKEVGGQIVLAAVQPHIKEVFDIAGFTSLFKIFDAEDEAVNALS